MTEQPAVEPHVKPSASSQAKMSGLAIAGFVCGIAGFLFVLFGGFVVGIVAITLSAMAISRINKDANLTGKGFGIAGLILGIVDVAISLIISLTWLFFSVIGAASGYQ